MAAIATVIGLWPARSPAGDSEAAALAVAAAQADAGAIVLADNVEPSAPEQIAIAQAGAWAVDHAAAWTRSLTLDRLPALTAGREWFAATAARIEPAVQTFFTQVQASEAKPVIAADGQNDLVDEMPAADADMPAANDEEVSVASADTPAADADMPLADANLPADTGESPVADDAALDAPAQSTADDLVSDEPSSSQPAETNQAVAAASTLNGPDLPADIDEENLDAALAPDERPEASAPTASAGQGWTANLLTQLKTLALGSSAAPASSESVGPIATAATARREIVDDEEISLDAAAQELAPLDETAADETARADEASGEIAAEDQATAGDQATAEDQATADNPATTDEQSAIAQARGEEASVSRGTEIAMASSAEIRRAELDVTRAQAALDQARARLESLKADHSSAQADTDLQSNE